MKKKKMKFINYQTFRAEQFPARRPPNSHMIHARYTACVVAPGLVVASEVSVENEWQEKAILTATLMAIGAGIYAVRTCAVPALLSRVRVSGW